MWLVIGLSGVTCSGKTTLAASLLKSFPNSVCVNQDKYFFPESSKFHTHIPSLNHHNWELLSSVNMEQMIKDIHDILKDNLAQTTRVLIIEGHTIFNYAPIAQLCKLKFYLYLSREECVLRRSSRVYDPADVPGYFDQVVWPEHLRHFEEMKATVKNIKMLDGMTSQEELVELTKCEIVEMIQQCALASEDL